MATAAQNAIIAIVLVPIVIGVGSFAWRAAHRAPEVIENLDGGDEVIDRGAFAVSMLDEAREQNPRTDVQVDEQRLVLTWSEGNLKGEYDLAGAYREFLAAAPASRSAIIRRRAGHIKPPPLPTTLAEAEPHLVAVVRERIGFEIARIAASKKPEVELPPAPPHVALTDDLWGVLAYETDGQFLRIDQAVLERWNAKFEDLWPKALKKLELSSQTFSSHWRSEGKLRNPNFFDENASARILLPAVLAKLTGEDDAIVGIPKDDLMLVTGASQTQEIDALVTSVSRQYDQGGEQMRIFRVDKQGAITLFIDPQRIGVRQSNRAAVERDEELQRIALRTHYGQDEKAPFVATLKRAESPAQTDALEELAVQNAETPTLLPRADWVVFRRVDASTKTGTTLACGTWDRVYTLMKTRWKETPLYPKRWLANDLPTPSELAALGCENPALR